MVVLTNHAKKRLKRRLKLKKSLMSEYAEKALTLGTGTVQAKGNLKRYLNKLSAHSVEGDIKVYHQFVFVFRGRTLVTVYPLPGNLVKRAGVFQQSKEAPEIIDV